MAHLHPVYDTDPHFSIDSTTRGITYESKEKLVIVQGDHNSQRYTFELPRYIDGHDMMLCDLVQVHYINIESGGRGRGTGVYKATDMQLAADDQNTVVLSWLVSQNATKYVGSLNFVLRFACTSGSKIDYAWSTTVYSAVAIITSIDNADLVVEQYADVLEQWYMELTMAGVSSVDTIYAARDAAVEKAKTDINTAKTAAIQAVQETDPNDDFVKRVADKIPVYGEDGEILGYDGASIITGTGKNSLVGNDTQNNTAISENVTSFGTGNIGGLKGYYWSAINLSAKTITLATAHTGGSPVTCGYAVGDIISIVNESKFEECSKITAINGSVVTVNSFPFTTVATGAGDFSDYCIYCPAKANIGLADLGKAAWIAGSGNKGGNYCAIVAGRDNNVIGQYGVAVGRSNKVGYAGFSAGRDNTCTGQYGAVAGGSWNNLTASWSFAAGRANNLNGLYSGSFGRNNSAGVRGYYFTNSGSGADILLYSDSACTTPANCSYAIGDVLTAGIGARSINTVYITGFTGNKVTLSSRINLSDYSATQRFIYCEQKSAVGAVAVTSYATAFGLNCKALGEGSVAAGRNCVVPSVGGVAIGVDNRAGYSSFVGGGDNQTDKEYCVLLGNGNRVTDNQSYAIGQGLKINSTHQCVVGRYNNPVSNIAAFVVGAGTSDTDRKNAMWVTTGGNIVAGGSKLILNGNGTQVSLSADQLTKLLALIK